MTNKIFLDQMTKLATLLLITSLSFSVTSCGSESDNNQSAGDQTPTGNNNDDNSDGNNGDDGNPDANNEPVDNDGDGNNNNQTQDFTSAQYSQLLANSADTIYAGYTALASSTSNLQTAITSYCADTTSRSDSSLRSAAQDAFITAMNDVQYSVGHTAKGQGLDPALDVENGIEVIYSWPLTNLCSVDKKLALNSSTPGNLLSRRGLDTIEYLLFVAADNNSICVYDNLSTEEQNNYTNFNNLTSDEKTERRCNYMNSVMANVVEAATAIKDAWDPAVGNFIGSIKSSSYPKVPLNKISDAMYFLADIGKEDKLAQPMGTGKANTVPSCGLGNPCPQDVESPYSRISFDNLIANTLSLQTLYFGGAVADKDNNIGFDDWLIARNETATANEMASDIEAVLTGLNTLKTNYGDLYTAITDGSAEVETFFDGPFQSMTRGYRENMLTKLDLLPPQSSLADND